MDLVSTFLLVYFPCLNAFLLIAVVLDAVICLISMLRCTAMYMHDVRCESHLNRYKILNLYCLLAQTEK